MTYTRTVALVLVALGSSLWSGGCLLDGLFTSTQYTAFERVAPITCVDPGEYGPNPAVTKMWQSYYGGGPNSLARTTGSPQSHLQTRGMVGRTFIPPAS